MKYTNCEEIREAFIKDGWSADITFSELSVGESKHLGHFIRSATKEGHKFFKMNETGNVFNDCGRIVYYNIPCATEK